MPSWTRSRAQEASDALARLLAGKYAPARASNRGYDFQSEGGDAVIDLRLSLHGTRDLDAALIHLALLIDEVPGLRRATLVATAGRMSAARIVERWKRVQRTILPQIAKRSAMVVLTTERVVIAPEPDDELQWLAEQAQHALGESTPGHEPSASAAAWTPRTFDVWMVLFDAWLRGRESLGPSELARKSGCSYPTIVATLDRLAARGELDRSRGGRARFLTQPRRSLSEILVNLESLRPTLRLVDYSGRRPEPETLLRRLHERAPAECAVGGVVAAHHYVSDFDLSGVPRIDLSLPGVPPSDQALPAWLRAVDPALAPVQGDRSPIVALHFRRGRGFEQERSRDARLPFASPAETLLDLHELRLTSQADEFVHALRAKGEAHR